MRRSLAILFAAATAVGASAATSSLTQAAPLRAPEVSTANDSVEQVRERRGHRGHGNRGHRGHRGHGGHRGGHHGGHHGHGFNSFGSFGFFPGLAFGFGLPQSYYYQPYYGYGDCFRTWDGQLICR